MNQPTSQRRIEPSVSLLQGKPYTNAANTDLRETFARLMAEKVDFNDDEAYRKLRNEQL